MQGDQRPFGTVLRDIGGNISKAYFVQARICAIKDCAMLMTSADDFFWTFEQAVSYYQFALVNYIGFYDKGMVPAGGCGDTNGRPQIDRMAHLQEAYEFGKNIYSQ